jgi:hypothetical protein
MNVLFAFVFLLNVPAQTFFLYLPLNGLWEEMYLPLLPYKERVYIGRFRKFQKWSKLDTNTLRSQELKNEEKSNYFIYLQKKY